MSQIDRVHRALTNRDPTRTVTLRNEFMVDMTRRLRAHAQDIKTSIVEFDVLGLRGREDILTLAPADPGRFIYKTTAEKLDEFMVWLKGEQTKGILEIIQTGTGPEPWTNTYIRSSYQKGMVEGRAQLRALGVDVPMDTIQGGGIAGAFQQPMRAETAALLYSRTYEQLVGVTADMDAAISRVLSQAIIEGVGPEEAARRLAKIEGVGITRARLIARTEMVYAFNMGALTEYGMAEGIIGEQIFVKWMTARDERVRKKGLRKWNHLRRHGKMFTQADGMSMLGDPNCRCFLPPYIPSIQGVMPLSRAANFR